jgi:hypothetical protein
MKSKRKSRLRARTGMNKPEPTPVRMLDVSYHCAESKAAKPCRYDARLSWEQFCAALRNNGEFDCSWCDGKHRLPLPERMEMLGQVVNERDFYKAESERLNKKANGLKVRLTLIQSMAKRGIECD